MTTTTRHPLRTSVALVWRTLRSMRTALILLLLLALASVAGSILPQIPNSPERVTEYLVDHPVWGELFLRAGFFDVFGSWWFTLVTVLLFVSLVACLIPRTRAHVRAMRQRPIQAREIDAFPQVAKFQVDATPEAAVEVSARVLRRRGFRVALDDARPALAAEKGLLRELGSLVFHWAFVLLLIAIIAGKGTGYAGRALIVEGETWTDALANYDGSLRAGRFFSGDLSGVRVRLLDYRDAFRDSGVPMDFQSEVELVSADGERRRTEVIRVNHPAVFDGIRLFQFGFGWAPVVEVADPDGPVRGDPVPFTQDTAPEGVSQLAMPWHGFVKLPTFDPPMAVELTLWPDSRSLVAALRGDPPSPMVVRFDPVMQYTVWRGELADLSLTRLDTTGLRQQADGVIGAGQTVDLERGCVVGDAGGALPDAGCDPGDEPSLTMGFPELRQFSVLQVSRDASLPAVLLAAILILVGLLPALYTSRRKVWVRVRPGERETTVEMGGFALQRKPQFEEEFAKLVDAIATASGGSAAPRRERERIGT